jgi:HD-GYP domain-containing protein (c-di-GMP phosphodiesterase class II)
MRMSQGENETIPNREETFSKALAECQAKAGEAFDPKLVEALALLVMGMQQGMSLQVNEPKIAAGMWLLDSYPAEELQVNKLKVEG